MFRFSPAKLVLTAFVAFVSVLFLDHLGIISSMPLMIVSGGLCAFICFVSLWGWLREGRVLSFSTHTSFFLLLTAGILVSTIVFHNPRLVLREEWMSSPPGLITLLLCFCVTCVLVHAPRAWFSLERFFALATTVLVSWLVMVTALFLSDRFHGSVLAISSMSLILVPFFVAVWDSSAHRLVKRIGVPIGLLLSAFWFVVGDLPLVWGLLLLTVLLLFTTSFSPRVSKRFLRIVLVSATLLSCIGLFAPISSFFLPLINTVAVTPGVSTVVGAWSSIMSHDPWMFLHGLGAGLFEHLLLRSQETRLFSESSSFLLTLVTEFGLLVVLPFIGGICCLGWRIWKTWQQGAITPLPTGLVISLFVGVLFVGLGPLHSPLLGGLCLLIVPIARLSASGAETSLQPHREKTFAMVVLGVVGISSVLMSVDTALAVFERSQLSECVQQTEIDLFDRCVLEVDRRFSGRLVVTPLLDRAYESFFSQIRLSGNTSTEDERKVWRRWVEVVTLATEKPPITFQKWLRLGEVASMGVSFDANAFRQAQRAFLHAREIGPLHPTPLLGLVELSLSNAEQQRHLLSDAAPELQEDLKRSIATQLAEAYSLLQNAAEIRSDLPQIALLHARHAELSDAPERAREILNRAIYETPNRSILYEASAGLALRQGDFETANERWKEVQQRFPERLQASWIGIATVAVEKKDKTRALNALEQLSERSKTDPLVQLLLRRIQLLE